MLGVILGVKNDTDFEIGVCKRTSQRLRVFLVRFYVNQLISTDFYVC